MNQAWRLYHSPHMLWARVLKAKFFPHTSLFESTSTSRGSHIWKALFNGIQWLREGMKWIIGDGHNIRIWEDHCIPGGTLRSHIAGSLMWNEENSRVSSLRVAQTWDLTPLHVPLPPQIEQLIHGIPVARIAQLSNTFVWPHNNGMCSVSSAPHFIYQQQQVPLDKQVWNWVWKVHCPKKIQLFLWEVMHNRLPTRQYLAFSHWNINDNCPRCHTQETTLRILHDCPWAKEVRGQSLGPLPLSFFHMPLQEWLRSNATAEMVVMHQRLPWKIYCPFLC